MPAPEGHTQAVSKKDEKRLHADGSQEKGGAAIFIPDKMDF